ncbi:hypothetical protein C8Q74DRAFT_1222438 [Fomes fomentarius]|nr:hypothetical protein C8Q74DRAFT_1222438 [Fomes fomentarius]
MALETANHNHLLVLDYDTLHLIMKAFDDVAATNSHLISFMRTDRTMYRFGIKILLDRGVVLDSARVAVSFSLFLAVDNLERAKLFKSHLTFQRLTLSEKRGKWLCTALRRVTGLTSLIIHHADTLFDSTPTLCRVLAGMTSLQHLKLVASRPTKRIIQFLSTLKSTLSTATLLFSPPQTLDDPIHALDPSRLLKHSQSTLTSVHISGVRVVHPEGPGSGSGSGSGAILPSVDHLHASDLLLPHTQSLVLTFPNVTSIDLGAVHDRDGAIGPAAAKKMCGMNRHFQLKHGSWTNLKRVSGAILDVLALGLTCDVETLVLEAGPALLRQKIVDLLLLTRGVVNLELTTCEDAFEVGWPVKGEELFKIGEQPEPDYAQETVGYTTRCLNRVFNVHTRIFKKTRLGLTTLRLRIQLPCPLYHCHYLPEMDETGASPVQDEFELCPLREAMVSYDLYAAAMAVFIVVPSVKSVTLELLHNMHEVACECYERQEEADEGARRMRRMRRAKQSKQVTEHHSTAETGLWPR